MYGWWYLLVYPPEGGWGVGWGSVALYTCQVEPERILIKVIAVYFYSCAQSEVTGVGGPHRLAGAVTIPDDFERCP